MPKACTRGGQMPRVVAAGRRPPPQRAMAGGSRLAPPNLCCQLCLPATLIARCRRPQGAAERWGLVDALAAGTPAGSLGQRLLATGAAQGRRLYTPEKELWLQPRPCSLLQPCRRASACSSTARPLREGAADPAPHPWWRHRRCSRAAIHRRRQLKGGVAKLPPTHLAWSWHANARP